MPKKEQEAAGNVLPVSGSGDTGRLGKEEDGDRRVAPRD
jgi:hypothetical protein